MCKTATLLPGPNSGLSGFTHSENLCILDEFNSSKDTLLGKFNQECSNKKKNEIWKKITTSVNSVNPVVVRNVAAVQKRFKNMVQEAKKELFKRKNPLTGGRSYDRNGNRYVWRGVAHVLGDPRRQGKRSQWGPQT